ncbi:GNAT family N-acetyltransferase [Qipengyuania sp. DGS5-3]|uniref:GNAT family N-acetyltransferase n=1 Tax=Qipengyuania sp. DGS5-3 TaxID=3349632 RepID=UPI0036D2E84D
MTAPSIRPMQRGDLDRVGHLVDATDMFPSEMLPEMTAPYFEGDTNAHRWIVYEKSGVSAVAYYVPEQLTDGTWNLLLIAVDPDQHGAGVGTALMRHVETELAQEGVRILLVETSGTSTFERTRGFYDMLGYDREALIRDYY